jgi:hypothetical protein
MQKNEVKIRFQCNGKKRINKAQTKARKKAQNRNKRGEEKSKKNKTNK